MALPRAFTVTDLYAMPESERGEPYELIDGELFVTPAPGTWHQTVISNLTHHISVHVRALRLD
jgi:Uma2 family endonuclease